MATNKDLLVEERVCFPAVAHGLDTMYARLEHFWQALERVPVAQPDMTWRMQFATALSEIIANIVSHAYCRQGGDIDLRLRLYHCLVEARLSDTGVAYVPAQHSAEPALADPLALPEGGYGLLIARRALDDLSYRRTPTGINSWRLRKKLDCSSQD